jgi:hypothetical protein
MTDMVWRQLEAYFAQYPADTAEPGSEAEVNELVALLGRPLPSDYREFLLRHGAALVGQYPIYGVSHMPGMGASRKRADDVKEEFRRGGWPYADEWLMVSADGCGNPIGIADDGRVLVWDHDFGGIYELGSNFEDFLCRELDRVANL